MTTPTNITNLNRRKCLRVGQAMIDGPSALFPPPSIDDYGWLEAEFYLSIKWPGSHQYESLQVFCDDSMNRDENFLPPMMRRCVWHREADLSKPGPWPTATVEIGYIRDHARMDALLRQIQGKLVCLPFASLGLSLQRDSAKVEEDRSEPACRIRARNGVQSIDYWSVQVPAATLGFSYRQLHAELLAEFDPISPEGWREHYDHDLRAEPQSGWKCEPGFRPADTSLP